VLSGKNIMKKTIIASAISLAFSSSAFADSTIALDDIVVTATRTPQPRESVVADVTVIDAETIERSGQTSLVELLQLQAGVEVSNNGGVGKTSNVFIRGTNSSHVLVLVDGLRSQSATTGTTTFENIPLNQIERIEILRGPATSLYGQDAIGGVIQIFTKKGSGSPSFYASAGYGRYDTKIANAGFSGKFNDTKVALNVGSQDIGGFSSLKSNNNTIKDNDGYRNTSFNLNLSHELTAGHEIGLNFLNSDGKTAFDNRFNLTDFDSRAKLNQQAALIFSKNKFADAWLSTLKLGFTKDNLKSYDEFGAPSFDRFDTKQNQLNWQNDITLPVGTLTLMYDRLEEKVESNTAYNKTKRTNEGFVASYLANIQAHTVHVSFREDHNTSFGNQQTGGVAYGYNFGNGWRATASYGAAFKAPSFNDLYFPDFFGFPTSNPNLVPEKSDNVEASVRYQDSNTQLSLTLYENKVRNLIALDDNFVPFNANKVTLQGLTLAANHHYDQWTFAGSIDLQSPRTNDTDNLLVRRANRHAKANIAYQMNDWRFGAELLSSSKRYNDIANTLPMAGYTLLNLNTEYSINQHWKVQARLNNALNKDYALAFDGNPNTTGFVYNTPGANLFVNIRWDTN
jgi:vitamin B12 transporter